jgi:hypothetical protein
MISMQHRSKLIFCSSTALLSLSLLFACKPAKTGAREDLISLLKGANVEGFNFGIEENETQAISSLTNSAVRQLVTLDGGTATLVLRYTSVKDKKTNVTKTSKTEIVKSGKELTLQVTDIANGEVIFKQRFPAPEPHQPADATSGLPTFDTLEACLNDFDCTRRGPLQCEANRTCQDQYAALMCCLKNGQCLSVHLVIKPTTFKCKLPPVIPDFEGVVFSQ